MYRRSFNRLMLIFLRIICCISVGLVKACRTFLLQMWFNVRIPASLSSLNRQKKLLIFTLSVIVFLLYLWLYWFPFGENESNWLSPTQSPYRYSDICLKSKLEKFRKNIESFNVLVNHQPLRSDEKYYLPYTGFILDMDVYFPTAPGNGYIGAAVIPQGNLNIKQNRALSVSLPFYPIVEVNLELYHESAMMLLDIYEGLVHKIQCFQVDETCLISNTVSYAHRKRPSVLVQEIRLHNPTDTTVIVDLRQPAVSDWSGALTNLQRISTGRSEAVEFSVTEGQVSVTQMSSKFAVVIANLKLPDTVSIKPSSTWTFNMVTVIRYQTTLPNRAETILKELKTQVIKEMTDAMNIEPKMLRLEHTNVWTSLWSSGFGISYSKAAGALNGDKINATMYYVLSNVPSPLFEVGHDSSETTSLEKLLYFPDRCYDGHHTLQNDKMWIDVNSVNDVVSSVNSWMITLEKQGCITMLRAGADGVLQAMMLSLGALKFSNHHLEFGTHPSDLHRDYFFRRINYGNDTHVNISVQVGEDNKAQLYVSLDRNNKPYYACDAGCLDAPVQLSRDVLKLPVKLTIPLTPILYVTSDLQHMEELKHAIHVREINEAPAHEHHVMVLHKHGNHWGGLPMMFWGTVTVLIIVFHLFLFKLIYNEYCVSVDSKYPRYSRSGRHV